MGITIVGITDQWLESLGPLGTSFERQNCKMDDKVRRESSKKSKKKRRNSEIIGDQVAIKKLKSDKDGKITWNEETDNSLIKLVEEDTKNRAKSRPKHIFVRHVDWKGIAQKLNADQGYNFDAASLRARWEELTKMVRKLRTVPEMIDDVKNAVKFHVEMIPKMPLGAYQLFCRSKRPRLKEKYQNMNNSELARRMGKKWRELPPEKKEKYEKKAKEKRCEYDEKLKEWELENPGGFKELNGDIHIKLPEKPKDMTPFEVFVSKKSKDVKEKHPDIDNETLQSKLKRKWDKLKEHKKQKYVKEAEGVNAEQRKVANELRNDSKEKKVSQKQSAYRLFFIEKRKNLLADDENLSFGEVSKTCSKLWKELDPQERLEFEEKAKQLNVGRPKSTKGKSKKPINAYSIFYKETRLKLLEENPKLEFGEIASLCSKKWKSLEADELQLYKNKEKELKEKYQEELNQAEENNLPED